MHKSATFALYHILFFDPKIGPQVLVLGEEALTNGLATSLLLRIHSHYEHLSREHDQTINHLTSQFPVIEYLVFVLVTT